jgi:hypothetical protein
MKHERKFWTRHVEGWRASGLTQQMYYLQQRSTPRRVARGRIVARDLSSFLSNILGRADFTWLQCLV